MPTEELVVGMDVLVANTSISDWRDGGAWMKITKILEHPCAREIRFEDGTEWGSLPLGMMTTVRYTSAEAEGELLG